SSRAICPATAKTRRRRPLRMRTRPRPLATAAAAFSTSAPDGASRRRQSAPVAEPALPLSNAELLERVDAIALAAGRVVMEVYATDFGVLAKGDASPVTL